MGPGEGQGQRLGHPPADQAAIIAAEERIGRRLPPSYREFLAVSDGWWPWGTPHGLAGTEGLRRYGDPHDMAGIHGEDLGHWASRCPGSPCPWSPSGLHHPLVEPRTT